MTPSAMMLSPNFALAEMTRSQTAACKGIDNTPSAAAVLALTLLCRAVLEPLRSALARPIVINSGYRSPHLNRAIGGAAASQHCLGEAADIESPGMANGDLALFIAAHLPFDQFILEAYTPGVPPSAWVHLSWKQRSLRNEMLTATPGPAGMRYSSGIHP